MKTRYPPFSSKVKTTARPAQFTIYYDGDCRLCCKTVSFFRKLDTDLKVDWQSRNSNSCLSNSQINFSVKDNLGNEFENTEARLIVLWIFPKLRFLAYLLGSSFLKPAVKIFFNLIANNRQLISKLF